MERNSFYLLAGAFLAGLLFSPWPWGWLGLGVVGLIGATAALRHFALPPWRVWVLATVLAVGASPYLYLRTPHPAANDISNTAPRRGIVLVGRVVGASRQNPAAQRFLLELDAPEHGRVAVRAPVQPVIGEGARVRVTGDLRRPAQPTNPHSFDERAFLAQQGAFSVLAATALTPIAPAAFNPFDWVRGRILHTHQHYLGAEAGALFSSLIVGSSAVDLPRELQDRYRNVGMAHLLAASGTQVSLILGSALALLRRRPPPAQIIVGGSLLVLFVGLAGASPSILRAAAMGGVALVALALDEKAEAFSALLLAACLLLLVNPLWIWDLGFAFSFLATLGLIVTAPRLTPALEALPAPLAAATATSLAAGLWTLPLQLLVFGQWSAFSLPLNVLAVPIVEALTLGGMAASLLALIHPALALPLDLPLGWLVALLDWAVRLVGSWPISLLTPGLLLPVQMIALYALLIAAHTRYANGFLPLAAIAVLIAPGWLPQPEVNLAVLAAGRSQVAVIEAGRRTLVFGGGTDAAVQRVLLPYLEQRGRLGLDGAIVTAALPWQSGGLGALLAATDIPVLYDGTAPPWSITWRQMLAQVPATVRSPLRAGQVLPLTDRVRLRVIAAEPAVLVLESSSTRLLLLGALHPKAQQWLLQRYRPQLAGVGWIWMGDGRIDSSLFTLGGLQGVLVSGRTLPSCSRTVPCWGTAEAGALLWQSWPAGAILRSQSQGQVFPPKVDGTIGAVGGLEH
ncbi:DNA internalization-related competence protein ComEC/Rec2 [Gloeobacter kilaueensis JS1]|uniref:DNA internalization-related competence protein ComEC/Rec2 n=1 Tax=Gloeobacter kilaueensis (strain ATCC BAA-2537 / CCAP 1431/1 / ULC 316 / JS1) TaxID=1183438 RepID=U5QM80_GLOK1|nr:DNA internalization-related competence protein ComEC/Rec2 [Gloeobacter kilaueensis JS1]